MFLFDHYAPYTFFIIKYLFYYIIASEAQRMVYNNFNLQIDINMIYLFQFHILNVFHIVTLRDSLFTQLTDLIVISIVLSY